jgi:DNA-directed RNA polymerase subunit N (RpoN/RPB10)
MIIPIKCVTCGNILADKYRYYLEQVRKAKQEKSSGKGGISINKTVYLTKENVAKTEEGEALDALGLFDPCCRMRLLTHVDIE